MLPGEACRECRTLAKERKRIPSCANAVWKDGELVRACEWMGGERLRRLEGLNKKAWRLCELAVAMSPADFNGNPTLWNLKAAIDTTPGVIGEHELARLVRRVCIIYGHFWLPYTAEKRDQQGDGRS